MISSKSISLLVQTIHVCYNIFPRVILFILSSVFLIHGGLGGGVLRLRSWFRYLRLGFHVWVIASSNNYSLVIGTRRNFSIAYGDYSLMVQTMTMSICLICSMALYHVV